jgi:hypothetical protein
MHACGLVDGRFGDTAWHVTDSFSGFFCDGLLKFVFQGFSLGNLLASRLFGGLRFVFADPLSFFLRFALYAGSFGPMRSERPLSRCDYVFVVDDKGCGATPGGE